MQLIKNSSIYLGSSILNKSIPFLLLPILTEYLSTEEFGILSIFQLFITFYSAFIGMAIHTNISKNFYTYSKDKLAILIGNILIILCITTLIFFVPTLIGSFFSDSFFSVPSQWVNVIPFISFMFMMNTINLTILRNEENSALFGVFEVTNTIVNMGVSILLLIVYKLGWESRAYGIVLAYFLFFIISLIYMKRHNYLSLKYEPLEIKNILNISLPLIPHAVGGIIISLSDRFFIEKMIGIDMVGIYSVGYMFGMIIFIFSDAFIKAWSPWFYKKLAKPSIIVKKKIVKYSYLYIIGLFAIAFLLSIISKLLIDIFIDEKFNGAEQFIFWISMGYAIHGVYKIFFPYLVHINKTSFLGYSTMLTAIINLLLNYTMINNYGAIGATYATAISFSISTALVFWYQNKEFEMPWFYFFNK